MLLSVETKKIKYELDIKRRVTVVLGESGTGKTHIIELINDGEKAGVTVLCERRVLTVTRDTGRYIQWFDDNAGSIVFIDESDWQYKSAEFCENARNNDIWLVICTRSLHKLPVDFAVKSVLELKQTDKIRCSMEHYKFDMPHHEGWKLITEDSKFGYNMFNEQFPGTITLEGKDNVGRCILNGMRSYVYIIDGAAFGNCIQELYEYYARGMCDVICLESFEELMLHSSIFRNTAEVSEVLADPGKYGANDREYNTWESFFTKYLADVLDRYTNHGYGKKRGTKCMRNYALVRKCMCAAINSIEG